MDQGYGAAGPLGLRLQGAWQQPRIDWVQKTRRIDSLSGDLSLVIRPIPADPGEGVGVFPYLVVGGGGVWYDLGRGPRTVFPEAGAMHDGSRRVSPTVVLAAGLDLSIPVRWFGNPLALRLEASNHRALDAPLRHPGTGEALDAVDNRRIGIGLSAFVDGR